MISSGFHTGSNITEVIDLKKNNIICKDVDDFPMTTDQVVNNNSG